VRKLGRRTREKITGVARDDLNCKKNHLDWGVDFCWCRGVKLVSSVRATYSKKRASKHNKLMEDI